MIRLRLRLRLSSSQPQPKPQPVCSAGQASPNDKCRDYLNLNLVYKLGFS